MMNSESSVPNGHDHDPELTFPLVGPGGEPIDLWRTLNSHGMSDLPPMRIDEVDRALEVTLPLDGMRPRRVHISQHEPGLGRVTVLGGPTGSRVMGGLRRAVRHILRLDDDLSGFYQRTADDPELSWVNRGAGRMIRGATVFEDVIKTVCTTNCAWSATQRMVSALVEHLGDAAYGAPATGPIGRAFPTPEAMADASESFYEERARAGYRGRYLLAIARSVAEGTIDLEELGRLPPEELSDEELESLLLEFPGIGPYAAAHIMLTMGRYSRLILDSWTRPKYARLLGRKSVSDAVIKKRFRRFGDYAGLAFWMFLTRDWVGEPS